MSVIANYLAVIFIWSTTPLAIKFSNESLSPFAAIGLRMLLALVLLAVLVHGWKRHSRLKRAHWKIYLAAGFGIFPNMLVVYMAAQYIASGMIAVMFALSAIVTGILAMLLLGEKSFNRERIAGIALAFAGLVVIFFRQMNLGDSAVFGLLLMLLSVCLFSISQVAVKYYQRYHAIDALEQTYGALWFSVPGLVLCWGMFDASLPAQISRHSLWAVIYLALVGSLLGFVAYYFVLSRLSVTIVALIPLITPAAALWLGSVMLDEPVQMPLMLGSMLILIGLAVYDGVVVNRLKQFLSGIAIR